MAPKGHPGLMVAIGMAKPKQGPPASVRSRPSPSSPSSMPNAPADPMAPQHGMGGKASEDEAGFVDSDNRCGDCVNWHLDSNSCDKVEGSMMSGDGCRKFYEPRNAGGMMADTDETGELGEQNQPMAQ